MDEIEPVQMPMDGTLDLHTFHPREIKDLVPEYLQACRERGILSLRIVHGKGDGTLKRMVHAILKRTQAVCDYRLAAGDGGSWGATLVQLRPIASGESTDD